MNPPPRKPVRWWPAVAILAVVAVRLAFVWLGDAPQTQARVVPTLKVAVLAVAALLLWVLLFSRLPGKTRLAILLTAVALALGLRATVRIIGVTGDARPILEWRGGAEDFEDPEVSIELTASDLARGAADYPQFYGPRRDAALAGPRLARDWSEHPPEEVWRRRVGAGWSAFAVAGRAAVTQEQRGEDELVVRYDLATGRQVWAHTERTAFESTIGGRGPRATPTIADGRVYALGGTGILNALDLETGRAEWSRDLVAEHGARVADYGMSSSPLLVDDLVVVQLARNRRPLVAHRRSDGEPVWRAGAGSGSYSSPALVTLGGVRQIVVVYQDAVAGHAPETGEVLWRTDWPVPGEKITPPLPLDAERMLVSAGYGAGSRLLRLVPSPPGDGGGGNGPGGLAVEEVWSSPRLKSKFASMVLHQGTVYGLDDGVLTALDPETGERRWKSGRYGHGQIVLAGDLLLIQTEKGGVALVAADPGEHRELGSLPALAEKTWNPPALAGRYLLVRNDREAACYRLAVE